MPPKNTAQDSEVETTRDEELAALAEPAERPEIIDSPVVPEPTVRQKAVVVAGGTNLPDAPIQIVVEGRKFTVDDDGKITGAETKKSHYPTGAQTYLRYDPEVTFPKDAAEVLTMGVDVFQHNFAGFTRQRGHLNVGPAHPAYAAANLAYQRGATDIEIVGLSDHEKERLQPYFDRLATDPAEPAQVTVTFS